ncbi:MAG: hypothetical protein E7L40_09175 [Corynebacterium kroppenstedtii]|nr:hypothetical protein [Corynebacterium kroppenstedtii]
MPMDKAERKEITQIKESIPRLDEDIDAISSALERTAHEVVDRDKKRKQTQQTPTESQRSKTRRTDKKRTRQRIIQERINADHSSADGKTRQDDWEPEF